MSVHFQGKQFNITIIVYAPTTDAKEAEIYQFYEDLQDLLELTPKTDVLFIIGNWNAKIGSQEIPGIIGKFGLGVQNEAGQRLTEFCQENTMVIANTISKNSRDESTYDYHQIVNNKIRLIIFFAAKDGETLYGQPKPDLELSVAQIISSLLQNSGLG